MTIAIIVLALLIVAIATWLSAIGMYATVISKRMAWLWFNVMGMGGSMENREYYALKRKIERRNAIMFWLCLPGTLVFVSACSFLPTRTLWWIAKRNRT